MLKVVLFFKETAFNFIKGFAREGKAQPQSERLQNLYRAHKQVMCSVVKNF